MDFWESFVGDAQLVLGNRTGDNRSMNEPERESAGQESS
jgi:hypothetical protein